MLSQRRPARKRVQTHTCACGNSYVDTYVDALGHAWDNGKVTKEPTETEDWRQDLHLHPLRRDEDGDYAGDSACAQL